MSNKGNLLLIPTPIAADTNDAITTVQLKTILPKIRHFLSEDVRTCRRYLSSLKVYDTVETLDFSVLDKDTRETDLPRLLSPIMEGHDVGIMSEAGCPGIADPGALAVRYAHRHGIRVVPMVGPSAIFLALMSSGLNGQRFAFHGYIPVQGMEASRVIRDLARESRQRDQTQIVIETPYRNNNLLQNLVKNLSIGTDLCVALDVTGSDEFIVTQSVAKWKTNLPSLPKKPAVFLFLVRPED